MRWVYILLGDFSEVGQSSSKWSFDEQTKLPEDPISDNLLFSSGAFCAVMDALIVEVG